VKRTATSADRGPVIFQHIPKTAGVSVRSVMSCNFHLRDILHVPDRFWCDAEFSARAARKYRFIHGHLHFEFVKNQLDTARIVTFLRDPIERVLSLYFFLRNQDPQVQSEPAARHAVEQARALSISAFAEQPDEVIASMVSNYQLRVLLDASQEAAPPDAWVPSALGNLDHYRFVGIADADLIGDSILAMSGLFGWSVTNAPPRVNHTRRDSNNPHLAQAREVIASRNRLEIEFYNELRGRFLSPLSTGKAARGQQKAQSAERRRYVTGLKTPVTMDQPLRCWGWHDRETDSSRPGSWRCAAGLRAGLELKVPKDTILVLLLELVSAHALVSVRETQIVVGDRHLTSTVFIANGRWVIGAVVEREDVGSDGMLCLEIICKEGAVDDGSALDTPDNRKVTIALERINVINAAAGDSLNFDIVRQSICQGAARAKERDRAERHQAALTERAQTAETYCAGLESEIERRTKEVRGLLTTLQRERLEAEQYQCSLTDRAERAETYAASLASEATKRQQQLSALQDALLEAEHRVSAMRDAHDRQTVEMESYGAALVDRAVRAEDYCAALKDRAERAEAYCAGLTERAARAEDYCSALLKEVEKQRDLVSALRASGGDRESRDAALGQSPQPSPEERPSS
jgi:hypothetical protein